MTETPRFFTHAEPIKFEGRDSTDPLAFRWYEKDRVVLGKTMEAQLRFAIAYWHSLAWPGGDPFGGETFLRPWMQGSDEMAMARHKAEVGFDLFRLLDAPFFCFHDRDVAPEGATLAESNRNLDVIADLFAEKMTTQKVRVLWGTANLFSNRRYMAGGATNPDPEVFAYAAGQVKHALETTHRLGGANYVLWGGREGYETLLNTDLGQEIEQYGRFLSMVVEHKHKIGFKGAILVEPKPQEPTKHQYDFDVATVYGFLKRFGLEREVQVNIEDNHATLAGHTYEHEIATAVAFDIFGSLDVNRGDRQSGWDTDQFPNDPTSMGLGFFHLFRAGGFKTGGCNFDAKIRRQSLDPDDLLIAHVGGMDVCARALLMAEAMITDGVLPGVVADRYAGWKGAEGQAILKGERSLDDLAARVEREGINPAPRSGRQEYLENLVNRYL